jgi:hypothetical protein
MKGVKNGLILGVLEGDVRDLDGVGDGGGNEGGDGAAGGGLGGEWEVVECGRDSEENSFEEEFVSFIPPGAGDEAGGEEGRAGETFEDRDKDL